MKLVGLVIAKQESGRLPYKNTRMFHGKPMFLVNMEKLLTLLDDVYVSSDSEDILDWADSRGGIAIKRPDKLCGDTPNIPVYQHALKFIEESKGEIDGIIAVQANSPNTKIRVIKDVITALNNCDEVMTCHTETLDNTIYGSVWAIRKKKLKNYRDPYKPNPDALVDDSSIDIHTLEDYKRALKEYEKDLHNS